MTKFKYLNRKLVFHKRIHKMYSSIYPCFSTFLLERNPSERLDCSRKPCSDTRVCSIPNGQKQHFFLYLVICTKKSPIDTGVCV